MTPGFLTSLSFRLAIAYAGLLCLSMALLSAAYYWIAIARPLDEIRAQVNREAQVLAQTYIVDGDAALVAALEKRSQSSGSRQAFHAFISPEGRRVSANLPSWPARPVRGWFSIEADIYREGDEVDFSALSRDRIFRNGARLIVGRNAEEIEDREEVLANALPWLLGLTILFGIAGGLFMSRAITRRLDTISATARSVIAGNLGGRVAIAGKGDDFDRLAGTINVMLARNQELFEAVRRVSDSAAHELRSPLARLIARLETLEVNIGHRPELEAAIAEAHRLQSIFNALLRIARIEGGRYDGCFSDVDLAALAADAVELYAPLAAEKGVEFLIEADVGIATLADRDLVFQALVNLLDNAFKHTPAGGCIRVKVHYRDDEPVIDVIDSGPGLQPGDAERITERFFRGEGTQGLPGEGLGLSLVAAIVHLHGARLVFHTLNQGLHAQMAFMARP
ncbi:MAG: ATP-binding protein [Novosphingobium sp.]